MEKIKINDIDFSKLQKLYSQGTKSVVYRNEGNCIKIFNDLYDQEKKLLYKKFMSMEGITIKDVILPTTLIVENDKLQGYIMEYFENSSSLFEHFCTHRYVNVKEMFEAIKKASLILKEIHSNNIILQDLNFDNILIDKEGNIKYCDIDGCAYNEMMSPYISIMLNNFIKYRKDKLCLVTKNLDRISFMLSFFVLTYLKEIQKVSKKTYHTLSDKIKTLENCREFANELLSKRYIPEIPYLDELIYDEDEGYIDRMKQISLIKRIIRK